MFLRCLQSIAMLLWTILNGKVCVVCVICFISFQLGAFRIQNLQRTHVETVSTGMDYTFPVLLIWFSDTTTCAYFFMGRRFIV
jgi:hypothetical protein